MLPSLSSNGIKKRNKVSYTCKICRLKRTKCDKKTPCSACQDRNSVCEYDTERQPQPRKPNKDSLILRLSNQLDYYKKISKQFVPNSELRDFDNNLVDIEYALGKRTLKKYNNFMASEDDTANDVIIQSNKSGSADMLSLKYLLKNDDNIKKVFFKKSNQNPTKPAKLHNIATTSLYFNKLTSYQKKLFTDFTNHLLFKDKSSKAHSTGIIESELYGKAFKPMYYETECDDEGMVEDFVVDEPSTLLRFLQEEITKNLPSYTDLHYLINVYINNFYSEAPLFVIDEIQTFIEENIFQGENNKIVIKPLETNIRNKLCYYAMIFIICGASNISLKLKIYTNIDNTLDFDCEIDSSKTVSLAMRLIKSSHVHSSPNIIKLTALMNIWMNFCYLPNPNIYSTDSGYLPRGMLIHLITLLSDTIDLYPLNHDNPQVGLIEGDKEQNLQNYYVLVFSIVVSIDDIYTTKCITFKIDDIQRERLLQYSYKNNPLTNTLSVPETINSNYNLYLVKLSLLYQIQECFSLITKLSGTMNFTQFEKRLNFMLEFYNRELSLNYMKRPDTKSIIFDTFTPKIKIDQVVARNKILMEIHLIKATAELKIYSSLLIKLEGINDTLYMTYFMKLITKTIDCFVLLHDSTNGYYQKYLGDLESVLMAKNSGVLFDQAMFTTLQILSKLILNRKGFESTIVVLFKMLYKSIHLYTKRYRFIDFKAFKVCLFLENVLIKYLNEEYEFLHDEDHVDYEFVSYKEQIETIIQQSKLMDIIGKDGLKLDIQYMALMKRSINFSDLFTAEFLTD